MPLTTVRELLRYGHAANIRLLDAAAPLDDAQLDQSIDVGLGSIRRILRHVLAGETVWLARAGGQAEAPWPDEKLAQSVEWLRGRFDQAHEAWAAFLTSIEPAHLDQLQPYRDSKGTTYRATLREMLIQAALHSHHHRAQLSYAIKRVAGVSIDLDYMYATRREID